MKYLWFFSCLAVFVKGLFLTYAASSGLIVGAEKQDVYAVAIVTAFIGIGCYALWPWKRK